MSKFKVGQVWVTRDGRKARIVATDCKDADYPVVALLESDEVGEEVQSFTPSGAFDRRGDSSRDLIREHREPREWWANIYEFSEQPALHFSKAYADEAAGSDRIECIRVREVIE